MNYFEVLGLSVGDIQGQDEATIQSLVKDAWTEHYNRTIGAYANIPRSDGRTQAQWQVILNEARDTLIDPQKRQEHMVELGETSRGEFIEDAPSEMPEQVPVNTSDQSDPLALAVVNNDYAGVEALIKRGADVNMRNAYNYTLLHYAAEMNAFETAQVLLDYGADINAKDGSNQTPLQVAEAYHAYETAEVFRQHFQDSVFGYLYKTSREHGEIGIPFQQISWQPTITLWLVRSWLSGLVFMIITWSLPMWVFYPITLLCMGLFVRVVAPFAWGRYVAIAAAICSSLGDPVLYMLNKNIANKNILKGKLKFLNCFNYMAEKPFNLVQFVIVLKER